MKSFLAIGSVFLLVVIVHPGPSLAHQDNVLLYSGSMCRLRGDDLRDGRWDNLSVSQFGWIGNRSADGDPNTPDPYNAGLPGTIDLHVVCPIVRFARRRNDGVTVIVRFRDSEPDGSADERARFCCTLHNNHPQSGGAQFSDSALTRDCRDSEDHPQGLGDAEMELTESNRKTSSTGVDSQSAGTYTLTCLMPPGSRLIDYTVHERH